MNFLSLRFQDSPLVPYAKAWEYQKTLVERRIHDEIPDTVLFVEHPPVVTRGRGLQWTPERDGKSPEERAAPLGALPPGTEYFEIERGGDLTWHGPGQLVIYPIVKLDGSGFGPNRDVTAFLRKLESRVCEWLEKHGVQAGSRANAAGIWVSGGSAQALDGGSARNPSTSGAGSGNDPESQTHPTRKIASVGVAVRKWVTYHGLGLNLTNSLEGFQAISPCGFDPEVMTTLVREVPAFGSSREEIEKEIARLFSTDGEVTIRPI